MGFSLNLALRYMGSRKRAFISVSTVFAIIGVALGTAALAAVMSVTGGFRAQFRDKVLGVNAHVLVLSYASEFRDYRDVMEKVETLPEVTGVGPFVINPMMLTHAGRTATGVLLKGVDPARVGDVLSLPQDMVKGSLDGLVSHRSARREAPPSEPRDRQAPRDEALESEEDFLEVLRNLPPLGDPDEERSDAVAGEGAAPAAAPSPRDAAPLALAPSDLPAGSVVPKGGYESELPPDDALPDELVSDPCAGDTFVPGIVIGVALEETLAVGLGDCIQVTSPTIGYSFVRGALRPPVAKQFRVVGVFRAGFEQYDSRFVYTELREAQDFYQGGDTVTGVEMKIRDIDRAPEVADEVEALLASKVYNIIDWEELNHGLFTALRIQQVLMSLVLALIILIAAFTVIATLIMIVLDKKKEIAVIKAMGASDRHLLRAFLYQGLIIGCVGSILGLAVGYAFCRWILAYGFPLDPKVYFISRLPVQIRPGEFFLTGAFAVGVCLLATAWPALYAARLRPAEAFREA